MKIVQNILAQGPTQPPININPTGQFANLDVSFGKLVQYGIQLILVIAAVIFFFILVMGGVKWITSGGDKGQTEAARAQITAAFVGLVIVFASWAILALISTFFGVDLTNLSINPTTPIPPTPTP